MFAEKLSFLIVTLIIVFILIVLPSSLIINYLRKRKLKRNKINSGLSHSPYYIEPEQANYGHPIHTPVLQKIEAMDGSLDRLQSLETAIDMKIKVASAAVEESSLIRAKALEQKIEHLGQGISQITVKVADLDKALKEDRGEETTRQCMAPVLQKIEAMDGSLAGC